MEIRKDLQSERKQNEGGSGISLDETTENKSHFNYTFIRPRYSVPESLQIKWGLTMIDIGFWDWNVVLGCWQRYIAP